MANTTSIEPTTPEALVSDAWLADPAKRAEFERELERLDEEFRPVTDALEASQRLSAEDLAIYINARQRRSIASHKQHALSSRWGVFLFLCYILCNEFG